MRRSIPPRSFVTGFDVEEQSISWTVENFPLVRRDEATINSQKLYFDAGHTVGHPSKWVAILHQHIIDEKRWIGLYCTLKSPKADDATFKNAFAELAFVQITKKGKRKKFNSGRKYIPTNYADGRGLGVKKYIDAEEDNPEETLVLDFTFRFYAQAESFKQVGSLEATMEEFQVQFSAKVRKDLGVLVKNPIAGDVKIISKDKKEFTTHRCILSARSEVFAAMLSANMAEGNSGVVELPDISSEAIEVLLNFLYTGELLPAWSQTEVIVELTNAAAKYQLEDLLKFLDVTMGKVCQLENVGALMTLARKLSMKVAEEELMMFVRKEGVGSADNFIRMWNTELPVIDSGPTTSDGSSQEKKRKIGQD